MVHLNMKPDWNPKDPVIYIGVTGLEAGAAGVEWDVRACGSFLEDYGRWLSLCPGQELPK